MSQDRERGLRVIVANTGISLLGAVGAGSNAGPHFFLGVFHPPNLVRVDAKPKPGMIIGISVLRRNLRNADLGRIQPWAGYARNNSVNASSDQGADADSPKSEGRDRGTGDSICA